MPSLTTVLWLASLLLALVLLQRFLRVWWFERQRFHWTGIYQDRVVTLPVDGTVVYVRRTTGPQLVVEKLGKPFVAYDYGHDEPGTLIGIYMSPFDRHTVLAPYSGMLTVAAHRRTGRNLPMLDLLEYIRFYYFGKLVDWCETKVFGFLAHNEQVVLDLDGFKLVCTADRFVDKIDVFKADRVVARGEPIAHIRRGSQVDLFLPDRLFHASSVLYEVGDRVEAGRSLGWSKLSWSEAQSA